MRVQGSRDSGVWGRARDQGSGTFRALGFLSGSGVVASLLFWVRVPAEHW